MHKNVYPLKLFQLTHTEDLSTYQLVIISMATIGLSNLLEFK